LLQPSALRSLSSTVSTASNLQPAYWPAITDSALSAGTRILQDCSLRSVPV